MKTPSVTGDALARASSPPSRWIPALASTNTGTITKPVHGWQPMLEPLVGGDRRHQAELGGACELGRRLLAKRAHDRDRAFEVAAVGRVGARHQPDRQPGDRRMEAGLTQHDP